MSAVLPRTLEPEVMDTAEEAADYDAMDHSTVNRVFVSDFVGEVRGQTSDASGEDLGASPSTLDPRPWTILDVGTGTALIPIELVRFVRDSGDLRSGQRHGQETGRNVGRSTLDSGPSTLDPQPSSFHITAIDLAEEMLRLGRINVERAGHSDCIRLELVDAKRLPYADGAFDAVMSNSIAHHIPEPRGTLAEMWRVLKPDGLLFVRDLLRPESAEEVERIVATYAGDESPRQQQLFRQSLHAALTVEEVAEMLWELGIGEGRPAVGGVARSGDRPQRKAGDRPQLGDRPPRANVTQTSDRHWTIVARR